MTASWLPAILRSMSDEHRAAAGLAAHQPTDVDGGRIPSLDGVRALSIVLVLVGHVYIDAPFARTATYAIVGNHQLGVSIFFVISGFIITHLLLREEHASGRIRVGQFYLRRAFRILPVYFVYLIAVFAFSRLGDVDVPTRDFASAALFLRDYMQRPSGFAVSHTWSLSVEEHFYLVYPIFLLTVPRRWRAYVLAATVAAGPFLRFLTWALWPGHGATGVMFHTRMDSLAGGCLLAILSRTEDVRAAIRRAPWPAIRIVSLGLLFIASPLLATTIRRYQNLAGYTAEIVLICVLLVDAISLPSSWLGRLLNAPLAIHLGRISFSLYLWQQLFVYCAHQRFQWLNSPAVSLGAAVVLAELSYRFVEAPFLEWRRRLVESRRRPRSVALADAPSPAADGHV